MKDYGAGSDEALLRYLGRVFKPEDAALKEIREAAKLTKAMPNTVSPLSSPFFMNVGDKYVVSFVGLPAGK